YDFKIDDGFESEPAHGFQIVAVSGDAHHQRAKDDRHNDALNQFQENVGNDFYAREDVSELEVKNNRAECFHVRLHLWIQPAEQSTHHHRDEYPLRKTDTAQGG